MYDVIVVGGGHAGCEASNIAAKMGMKTLLLTMNKKNIADMPCNPSIGGTAKGVIVREIDALGGLMGRVADMSHFQIKMLNNSKGPAVRSLRAQADKRVYPKKMLEELEKNPNLEIKEGLVENLIVEDNVVKGVILSDNTVVKSQSVILTTGTYTKANILIGSKNTPGGPHGEGRSNYLSDNLKKLGLNIKRLKTGTPQRIKKDSIDFTKMHEEKGDDTYWTFSHDLKPQYKINDQQKCYLVYTNEKTHEIIRKHLKESAMYGGYATGVGPRYCPSIEDKIVRFADKERHQLFLEPESIYYDEWYLQGFSTSMPRDVQEEMVHSLKGLENAVITKYAYAIEYDAIDSLQIKASLENKIIENLFTAGQINGTSGYEEAAGQGLIAGINAALKLQGKEPLILKRNEAYIGVLIDDLVTKGVTDPYRMLTSRAEFRLILRHDNADLRLRAMGYELGTISKEQYQILNKKIKDIESLMQELKENKLTITKDVKDIFASHNLDEGYIKKANKEVEKLQKIEEKQIPEDIDYQKVRNLASEAKQKLSEIRPRTIAQASRISGVNPADIAILAVYLKKEYNHD